MVKSSLSGHSMIGSETLTYFTHYGTKKGCFENKTWMSRLASIIQSASSISCRGCWSEFGRLFNLKGRTDYNKCLLLDYGCPGQKKAANIQTPCETLQCLML